MRTIVISEAECRELIKLLRNQCTSNELTTLLSKAENAKRNTRTIDARPELATSKLAELDKR